MLPFMCGSGIEKKVILKWERKIVTGADLEGEWEVVGVLLFRCGFGKENLNIRSGNENKLMCCRLKMKVSRSHWI